MRTLVTAYFHPSLIQSETANNLFYTQPQAGAGLAGLGTRSPPAEETCPQLLLPAPSQLLRPVPSPAEKRQNYSLSVQLARTPRITSFFLWGVIENRGLFVKKRAPKSTSEFTLIYCSVFPRFLLSEQILLKLGVSELPGAAGT